MKKRAVFVRILVICTLLSVTFPLHAVPTLEAEAAAHARKQSVEEVPGAQTLPAVESEYTPQDYTQDHVVFLPLVVKNYFSAPADNLIVSWAQLIEGDERHVLLHWRTSPAATTTLASPMFASAIDGYAIDRRVTGDTVWQPIGQTGFASDAAEMEIILGVDLTQQLGYDLSGDPMGTPLTAQEIYDRLKSDAALVQLLSQAYYKVGLATGTSFFDRNVPDGVTLEYQVRDLRPDGKDFEPVSVPATTSNLHPPFDLRETWEGPDGLGQAPSDRPADALERYSWQTTSEYRSWDGKVYLIWNTPEDEGGGNEFEAARWAMNIAGYRIYRSGHGLNRWSSVNPTKTRCVAAYLCEMLVGVAPEPADSTFPVHYFVDDLHKSSPDPATVYDTWDYKVCAVDGMNKDLACSEVLEVNVRELQPSIAVENISTTIPEDQSKVTITWTYSDSLELNPPLRFYVTRSPTLTAPLDEWTVVKEKTNPFDYVEVSHTGPTKQTIVDYPPYDQVYWYRVQVRDNAGNWSLPSTPVKAARYTRTPPSLSVIPHDATHCELNAMPFTLSGLDDNVFLVNLYRRFDRTMPFELVERFEVTHTLQGNYIEINDDFLPSYPTYAYYRLEAVDDHGNVSAVQSYCAQLGDGPLMDPGLPIVTSGVECKPEQGCTFTALVGGSTAGEIPIGIETTKPGENGIPLTTTEIITASYIEPVNESAWINLRSWYGYGEPTISNTISTWEHVLGHEFLDTDRNLNGLGSLVAAEWLTDTSVTPLEYYVRLYILADDSPTPPVVIFRRAEGGNWMQVSPVLSLPHHYFDDRSDPSPDVQYEYVILVLSPTNYELLGFWTPITVEPFSGSPSPVNLSGGIAPVPPINPMCEKYTVPGGPVNITLHNGWMLQGVTYWIADDGDPDCPPYTQVGAPDLDHAYGAGTLTNGTETWANVEFQDIAIDGGGQHMGGRIVAMLDQTYAPANRFKISLQNVEFTATDVRAEVTVRLIPDTIRVEIPGFDRTDKLFGVFSQLTTDYRFDPLLFDKSAVIIDENLPWRLHIDTAWLDEATLDLGAVVTTSFRVAGGGWTDKPDNNLALLRSTYASNNAEVTTDGLTGDFATGDAIEYVTSFPAGFLVKSQGGILHIAGSQITGGELWKAQALLSYDDDRTATDYVVANRWCDATSRSRYSLCSGFLSTIMFEPRILEMTPDPVGGPINVGTNGYLSATVTIDQPTTWPSFWTDPAHGDLFIAPATFPDAPTSWGPMPAEAAWQRLPDPETGGTFDPGLNLNSNDESVHYTFFNPSEFSGSAMNLYVRKGGVSGHVIMTDTGPRTNLWGYSENVQRIELVFLDNKALAPPEDFITDLMLPYPTDATMPLTVTVTDSFNRPLSGVFREPTDVTHSYWSFTETPSAWAYAIANPTDYTTKITGILTRVLTLQSSAAVIPGLQPADAISTTLPVGLLFNSEWLPDGDVGALRILPPDDIDYRTGSFRFILSAVKLSRYYSGILDDASKPSTLGIDLADTMDVLPTELLDGNGNLTGDSLAYCAATTHDGCGLIVLDGDIGVDYFGEVKGGVTAARALAADIPAVDNLVGEFPLAVNYAISATKFIGIQSGHVPWVWPILDQALDVDLPVKFLGNTEGGILVALLPNAPVFPDTEIFRADVAAIVDIRWDLSTGYNDMVSIYLGYGASQAAFRALAMNRPKWSGGIQPYDQWSQVSGDIGIWADKFGYSQLIGSENDPVDLAEAVWENLWCTEWSGTECREADRRSYNEVFDVLEPVLKGMSGDDAYGVIGVEAGSALQKSNISMNTTTLGAVFRRSGLGLELTQLEGAGQVIWDLPASEDPADIFFSVDWITFKMDRDGEIEVTGDVHLNLLDIVEDVSLGIDGHLHALATPVGDEWRFEGAADLDPIGIAGLSALELDGVFGMGPYIPPDSGATTYLYYFGGNFEAYFRDYLVGGGFLYGVIPQESVILREAGFGEILDTLGDQGSYEGIYAYVFGDFPIAGDNCLLEASAGGEIRFWYYWSDDIWGGELVGFVHATALCVFSARGQLELGYARLDNGGQMYNRTCENSKCDIYGGAFWIATGFGWCEPSSWRSWESRWWGDSWCYCIGAYVDLSYMVPGGLDHTVGLDYE